MRESPARNALRVPRRRRVAGRHGARPAGDAGGRSLLILIAMAAGIQALEFRAPWVMAVLLSALLVPGILVSTGTLRWGTASARVLKPEVLALVMVGVTSVAQAGSTARLIGFGWPVALMGSVLILALTFGIVLTRLPDRRRTVFFAGLVVASAAAMVLVALHLPAMVDVAAYAQHATTELSHLRTPYGGMVPNPYDAGRSALYLAPELVSADGRSILIGFPYLPGSALVMLPAHWLGAARLGGLGALALCGWCWWKSASDDTGRRLALTAVSVTTWYAVTTTGYVEPYLALALALLALSGLRTSGRGVAASVAFLVAGKQYVALVFPFLISTARRAGRRPVLWGAGAGGFVSLLFFVWSPSAFWHDVVETQLIQPIRPDSISLLVAIDQHLLHVPAWSFAIAPIVGGLAASGLVALRGRPGATTTSAAFGLGLLATVLLSKQAVPNYFLLIQLALVTAAIAWPHDGPAVTGGQTDPGHDG